jgi:hypothetical protein
MSNEPGVDVVDVLISDHPSWFATRSRRRCTPRQADRTRDPLRGVARAPNATAAEPVSRAAVRVARGDG